MYGAMPGPPVNQFDYYGNPVPQFGGQYVDQYGRPGMYGQMAGAPPQYQGYGMGPHYGMDQQWMG